VGAQALRELAPDRPSLRAQVLGGGRRGAPAGRVAAGEHAEQYDAEQVGADPLDAWGRPEAAETVEVLAAWTFEGVGHRNEGERWLALASAARAREWRRLARQERAIA
jgi:hypothetical protein